MSYGILENEATVETEESKDFENWSVSDFKNWASDVYELIKPKDDDVEPNNAALEALTSVNLALEKYDKAETDEKEQFENNIREKAGILRSTLEKGVEE